MLDYLRAFFLWIQLSVISVHPLETCGNSRNLLTCFSLYELLKLFRLIVHFSLFISSPWGLDRKILSFIVEFMCKVNITVGSLS